MAEVNIRRGVQPVAGIAVVIVGWSAAVQLLNLSPLFLPAPSQVGQAIWAHGPYLMRQTGITLLHTLGGFIIAAGGGITVAMLLAGIGWLRRAVLPMLVAAQAVPVVAIAPLLVLWLGFGHTSKVTLVVLLAFFPAVISTLAGLTSTPTELIELARSMCAPTWRVFLKIRLPGALPQTFTGLKVSMSLSLIGAVVAQISTPNIGLGAVIALSAQSANTTLAFAAITLLAILGIGLFYTVATAGRLLLPWAKETTS